MKVSCSSCTLHFENELLQTRAQTCDFWKDHGLDHLDWADKQALWECLPVMFDRMSLFHSREHYVSPVATYAERNRYAITAWFMNKENSLVYPVPDGKTRKPPELP